MRQRWGWHRVRRTHMDLSTKLKITAVLMAVVMAVVWTVPVPV
jgi:hypothetical protein